MSVVVLDGSVAPHRPSFLRVLGSVLTGYLLAAIALVIFGFTLQRLGILPESLAHSGPFPGDAGWSVAADVAAATVIVLVAAAFVRVAFLAAGLGHVSFGVLVVVVAVTGYAPLLLFRDVSLVALLATTWAVRRYAIGGTALRLPWRAWAALGLAAFAVFASYGVYHPLTVEPLFAGIDARGSGTYSLVVPLNNAGLAGVTILRVDGGTVDGRWHPHRLPWTLDARSQADLTVSHKGCAAPDVRITYSVLGLKSSQRLSVGWLSSCRR